VGYTTASNVELYQWSYGDSVATLPAGVDPNTCRTVKHQVRPDAAFADADGLYYCGYAPYLDDGFNTFYRCAVLNRSDYRLSVVPSPDAGTPAIDGDRPVEMLVTSSGHWVIATDAVSHTATATFNMPRGKLAYLEGRNNLQHLGGHIEDAGYFIHSLVEYDGYVYWIASNTNFSWYTDDEPSSDWQNRYTDFFNETYAWRRIPSDMSSLKAEVLSIAYINPDQTFFGVLSAREDWEEVTHVTIRDGKF